MLKASTSSLGPSSELFLLDTDTGLGLVWEGPVEGWMWEEFVCGVWLVEGCMEPSVDVVATHCMLGCS